MKKVGFRVTKKDRKGDKKQTAGYDIFGTVILLYNIEMIFI